MEYHWARLPSEDFLFFCYYKKLHAHYRKKKHFPMESLIPAPHQLCICGLNMCIVDICIDYVKESFGIDWPDPIIERQAEAPIESSSSHP